MILRTIRGLFRRTPARPQPMSPLHARVAEIIAGVRPLIRADGGDIDLLAVDDDGTVRVRLRGACAGCPASFMTLQVTIERRLREQVPQVRTVVNVP